MSCEHVLLNCSKCTAERDALRAEVEKLRAIDVSNVGDMITLSDINVTLRAEIERMRVWLLWTRTRLLDNDRGETSLLGIANVLAGIERCLEGEAVDVATAGALGAMTKSIDDACSGDDRQAEEGFTRIGRIDSVGRRSLWLKIEQSFGEMPAAIVLRAGREGDDAEVRIEQGDLSKEKFKLLLEALGRALYAAENR